MFRGLDHGTILNDVKFTEAADAVCVSYKPHAISLIITLSYYRVRMLFPMLLKRETLNITAIISAIFIRYGA